MSPKVRAIASARREEVRRRSVAGSGSGRSCAHLANGVGLTVIMARGTGGKRMALQSNELRFAYSPEIWKFKYRPRADPYRPNMFRTTIPARNFVRLIHGGRPLLTDPIC